MKEIDEDLKINATNEQVKLTKEFAEVCTALAHGC